MNHAQHKNAFTLIELLITISVMVVLAAIIIPSVRFISKERKAREAARILGATVVAAQSQAVADGYSGIYIERNRNFPAVATRIYRMKSPPPFSGYGSNAIAFVDTDNPGDPTRLTASLPVIFNGTLPVDERLVNINDRIQFNQRGPHYRITGVGVDPGNPTRTSVEFEYLAINLSGIGNRSFAHPPLPQPVGAATTVNMEFTIFRRPVIIPTTVTELPGGFNINLALSGHGAIGNQFNITGTQEPVVFTFDQTGALDLIYPRGLDNLAIAPQTPLGAISLLVSEFDVESNKHPLQNMKNLWVTVNRSNGIVSIGNMGSLSSNPLIPAEIPQALRESRQVSRSGKSANQ